MLMNKISLKIYLLVRSYDYSFYFMNESWQKKLASCILEIGFFSFLNALNGFSEKEAIMETVISRKQSE